jgi:hypothetical protein
LTDGAQRDVKSSDSQARGLWASATRGALRLGLLASGLAAASACSSSSSSGEATLDAGADSANLDSTAPAADSGADAAETSTVDAGFAFQPSNIAISDILANAASAKAESVTSTCTFRTDPTAPGTDCFTSPIAVVTQPDGSKVDLVVVMSLDVASTGAIRATGGVPIVIISLSDVTVEGSIDVSSTELNDGAGAASGAASNGVGGGAGGGAGASSTSAVGGGGASYCGAGGVAGGQTTAAVATYGNASIRPLVGGSSGGGGSAGENGVGGGAVQISAAGNLTVSAGSFIAAGGEGGTECGVSSDQGAGGGGSGGSILLEGTTVSVAGTLAANGGGGGGDYSHGPGSDATPNANPARGGAAGTSGGAGGNGSAAATLSGGPGLSSQGGNAGGGGGGAGRIRINSASGAATVSGVLSPSATTSCASQGPLLTVAAGP